MKVNLPIINSISTLSFDLGSSDKEFILSTKAKSAYKGPFYIAVRGDRHMAEKENSLLQKLGKMGNAERWFFLYLEARMDAKTNIAVVKSSELTKTQINYKVEGYRLLYMANMVKKVRREHYMINPNEIIPVWDYDEVKKMWDSLK
jgi:hypothetical protein